MNSFEFKRSNMRSHLVEGLQKNEGVEVKGGIRIKPRLR